MVSTEVAWFLCCRGRLPPLGFWTPLLQLGGAVGIQPQLSYLPSIGQLWQHSLVTAFGLVSLNLMPWYWQIVKAYPSQTFLPDVCHKATWGKLLREQRPLAVYDRNQTLFAATNNTELHNWSCKKMLNRYFRLLKNKFTAIYSIFFTKNSARYLLRIPVFNRYQAFKVATYNCVLFRLYCTCFPKTLGESRSIDYLSYLLLFLPSQSALHC